MRWSGLWCSALDPVSAYAEQYTAVTLLPRSFHPNLLKALSKLQKLAAKEMARGGSRSPAAVRVRSIRTRQPTEIATQVPMTRSCATLEGRFDAILDSVGALVTAKGLPRCAVLFAALRSGPRVQCAMPFQRPRPGFAPRPRHSRLPRPITPNRPIAALRCGFGCGEAKSGHAARPRVARARRRHGGRDDLLNGPGAARPRARLGQGRDGADQDNPAWAGPAATLAAPRPRQHYCRPQRRRAMGRRPAEPDDG